MMVGAVPVAALLLAVSWYPCIQGQVSGDLRLVSSTSTSSSGGRLEIYLQEQWGTVCDDGFGFTEADVACRQLGYVSASNFGSVNQLAYPQASLSTPIWLDDVDCSSFSPTLLSCIYNGIGVGDCNHNEDVAIQCSFSDLRINYGALIGGIVGSFFFFCCGICIIIFICVGASISSRRKRRAAVTLGTATPELVINATPSDAQYTPYSPPKPQDSGYTPVSAFPVECGAQQQQQQQQPLPYPDFTGPSNGAYVPPLPK